MNSINRETYSSLFSGSVVTDYEKNVVTDKLANIKFNFQRKLILRTLRTFFSNMPIQVDYACGTGRWLLGLQDFSRKQYGIDVSHDMISIARNKSNAIFIIPSTTDFQAPFIEEKNQSILITAFRFILNADDSSREIFLDRSRMTMHSQDEALLLFNNHGSAESIRSLWIKRKKVQINELSHSEIEAMLRRNGLRIDFVRGIGFIPEKLLKLLPILVLIELYLIKRGSSKFSYDRLYGCTLISNVK